MDMDMEVEVESESDNWSPVATKAKDHKRRSRQPKGNNGVIYSDISCDQQRIICGLANHCIAEINPLELQAPMSINETPARKHVGLSHISCSKINPSIFYSSSILDGSIRQWDARVADQSKPVQVFSLTNFGALAFGTMFGWSATALPDLREDETIGMTDPNVESQWIGSLMILGALVSGPIIDYFLERFGRRLSMLSLSAPCLAGWALIFFAQNVEMVYAGRFLTEDTAGITGLRPILSCDANSSDQLLCAGTELVNEDCHLLFWDARNSSTLLGAYWESHSDDILTVKFHSEKYNILASGSTDGLVNAFDLLQESEDDALLYSFNTETSVDSVAWRNSSQIVALTHTNEVQVWDAESGDSVCRFSREKIATAMGMKKKDSESVHAISCHAIPGQFTKLVVSLDSGNSAKILELEMNNKLQAKGELAGHDCAMDSVCYLHTVDRWIMFDEKGFVKLCSGSTT